jgi:putative flippase GtrA
MYDPRAMSSQARVRAPDESWLQALFRRGPDESLARALFRNVIVRRADNVMAQGMRFALSGAVVSIVYITITTLLSAVSHLPFQLALAIGWSAAICVHFTLQRTFVWASEEQFALPFRHQIWRYLLVAGSQLGITAATTAVLPSLLGVTAEVVYLATAALLTLINFLVFRNGIFHAGAGDGAFSPAPAAPAVPPRSP